MNKTRLLLGAVLATITIIGICIALPPQTRTQPANASQTVTFDHSNCQYPDRWSNPADGCDNSDPAVPECIKAAYSQESEQDCIAEYVKQHTQPEPATTTEPAITPTINTCEDK